jgi:hypothetical protein
MLLAQYQKGQHEWEQQCKSLLCAEILTQFGPALRDVNNERLAEHVRDDITKFRAAFTEEAKAGEVPPREEIIMVAKIYSAKTRSQEEEQEILALARRAQHFRCRQLNAVGRSLVRITGNMLGAGLPLTNAGDEVWFIYGMNKPMVLRPEKRPHVFRIIGECYLHGCTQGELFGSGHLHCESAEPIIIV